MGGPISITVCKPTLNNELKNFRIKIFNSVRDNLQDKLQETTTAATTTATTTSTTENYRNFRARFQWGHLRR